MFSMKIWINNEGFKEEVGLESGLEGWVDRIKEGGHPAQRVWRAKVWLVELAYKGLAG